MDDLESFVSSDWEKGSILLNPIDLIDHYITNMEYVIYRFHIFLYIFLFTKIDKFLSINLII